MNIDHVLKQQPEVFGKSSCTYKFRKIHSFFFNKVAGLYRKIETSNFIKKETLAQVFSCDFCEISKSTLFTEHLWATASPC